MISNAHISKPKFYLLSFTWGLLMTVIGYLVAVVLLILGYRPKRFGYCWHFTVGKSWGGLSLGMIVITGNSHDFYTLCHEHGHAIQNCYYGLLMPFIVNIPSAIRYWHRRYLHSIHKAKDLPPYDSIWFEGEATCLGIEFMDRYNKEAM